MGVFFYPCVAKWWHEVCLYKVEDSNWHCLLQRLDLPRSQPWRAKAKAKCIFSPAPQYGEPSSSIFVLFTDFLGVRGEQLLDYHFPKFDFERPNLTLLFV